MDLLHHAETRAKDPSFWQHVVLTADSFVTCNFHGGKCINNGTPSCLHSLSFDTPEKEWEFLSRCNAARPGDIVTLLGDEVPYSVNIVPWPNKKKNKNRNLPFSLLNHVDKKKRGTETVVIPLTRSDVWIPDKNAENGCIIPGGNGCEQSEACLYDPLPIELGFAMTFDKAQGRTLMKIILALERRPTRNIDFHLFLVALS